MNFEKLFRILSYAAVFCGFFSLWISGTFGIAGTGLFVGIMIAARYLEGSKWQVSERLGTTLIVLAIPFYWAAWRFQFFDFATSEAMVAGMLARLILSLSAIKLLQKKSDRDWIFLYLMAFFEVLLAAGLSISALYFFSFIVYIFIMVCAIILFEIKKTDQQIRDKASVKEEPAADTRLAAFPIGRIPATAIVLIIFIILLAAPMFFMLPRVGGAGLGGNQGGVEAKSGFSDSVKLGGIGSIQQNDEVVMRVRIENRDPGFVGNLHWRGIALDTFDNQSWSKSKVRFKEPRVTGDSGLIQVDDYATRRDDLTIQTIYLEPLVETPILFALPRPIGVQANFPIIFKDAYGALSFEGKGERISYKVFSDVSQPGISELRSDRRTYAEADMNYLQLPENLDPRIAALTDQVAGHTNNRYDAARAVESYLQNDFGYTLEQKAGGDEPLADFLFNVREGHCEYFATAMAVMLRTNGIATRVVNGFQQGEYNDTADVFVVRQRNAHSWVEVYFPGENAWVTFDPTPFAGQNTSGASSGVVARMNKYLEALETFWIQYFVAFDNQEQRSLFTSFKRGFSDYQTKTSVWMDAAQMRIAEWWRDVRGDKGFNVSVSAIGYGAVYLGAAILGILLLVWLYRKVVKLKVWRIVWDQLFAKRRASIVEFYDRMQKVLAGKGFVRSPHQTPLEFAFAVNMPEAVKITEKYNRVRFGEKNLSQDEAAEIETWLERISTTETQRHRENK